MPDRGEPVVARPSILWIGSTRAAEFTVARMAAGRWAKVEDASTIHDAIANPPESFARRTPAAILLATPAPAAWGFDDIVALSRRWPLAPIVSVSGSLVDGRRRSGPPLPGIEEVPWNELGGRLAWWMFDRGRGRPGGLGLPATARRDERILEASVRVAGMPEGVQTASVMAARRLDAEGLAELLEATGRAVVHRGCGRPAIDETADVIVWDVAAMEAADLTWLAMIFANRPSAAVILIDSFPRGDMVLSAIEAGASAVLSRPVSQESLTGLLLGGVGKPVIDAGSQLS